MADILDLKEESQMKSTVEEIRQRFDKDVERFSNLQTGQSATIDAPLVLDLIAQAAAATTPRASHLLDVGCGAGNYSLALLSRLPGLNVTLVDLSRPMLERALERIRRATTGTIVAHQADIRELELAPQSVDIIVAAAVLHHLRTDAEWEATFARFYSALRPGGSLWISDLIEHTSPQIQRMMWDRYGDYLTSLKDAGYRDEVFAYIAREDSPKPLMYQLDLMRRVGFQGVDVLHKNSVFAAFGGRVL
jgi:tRNA (cmo5U34)-methyltransferase